MIACLQAPLQAQPICRVDKSKESLVAKWIFLKSFPQAPLTFSQISFQSHWSQIHQSFFLTINGSSNEKISLLLTQVPKALMYPHIENHSATIIISSGMSNLTYCSALDLPWSLSSLFQTLKQLSSLFHSAQVLDGCCGLFSAAWSVQ